MLVDLYEIQQEENPEPLPQRKTERIPRHPDINEVLAKRILKNLS
jgi:hypothetical protein